MARVVALVFQPETRVRLSRPVSGIQPRFGESVRELHWLLDEELYDAAIVGLHDPAGGATVSVLEKLREHDSRLWITAYLERPEDRDRIAPMMPMLSRAGVNDVVLDHDEPCTELYRRIRDAAHEVKVYARVRRATRGRLYGIIDQFVEYSILHVRQPLTVELVAERMHISRRTLTRRCKGSGLLPPQDLLSWSRLLVAAALLEETSLSVNQIAYRLFSSPSAFRGMLRRYTALQPRAFRMPGGFGVALERFLAALEPASQFGTYKSIGHPWLAALSQSVTTVSQ